MTNTMQAAIVDPAAPSRLAIQSVDMPAPAPNELLVRVKATSLNLGEVRGALTGAEAGYRPGWDIAGVVERGAADGSGPREGARVVGLMGNGGWAEFAAIASDRAAELPDDVSFAQAATLPVAGLTALHAVERGVRLLGSNVLVTGASGGVGLFALQLARLSGASVYGLFRNADYEGLVRDAGATPIVSESAAPAGEHGPYQLICESVGGDVLPAVIPMLAPDGVVSIYGGSASPQVTLNSVYDLAARGRASLYGLVLFNEFTREPASGGLTRLTRLVSSGGLRPPVTAEESWTKIASVAQDLFDRKISGKAVLHFA